MTSKNEERVKRQTERMWDNGLQDARNRVKELQELMPGGRERDYLALVIAAIDAELATTRTERAEAASTTTNTPSITASVQHPAQHRLTGPLLERLRRNVLQAAEADLRRYTKAGRTILDILDAQLAHVERRNKTDKPK